MDEHIVRQVELTGKKWKLMQAAGFIIIFLGIILWSRLGEVASLLLMLVGSIIGLYGGIGAWWHHK